MRLRRRGVFSTFYGIGISNPNIDLNNYWYIRQPNMPKERSSFLFQTWMSGDSSETERKLNAMGVSLNLSSSKRVTLSKTAKLSA